MHLFGIAIESIASFYGNQPREPVEQNLKLATRLASVNGLRDSG
jgi:hypothetical protein